MPLILGTNSIKDTGYDVDNSCRFNGGSSDRLIRTQTAGNRRTYTISFWIKRSGLSASTSIIGSDPDGSHGANFSILDFKSSDEIDFSENVSGSTWRLITNRKFRDVSAWYHIVFAVDTTQGTASNRLKLYINGVQETSFSTENYPSQNLETKFNENSNKITVGGRSGQYVNGYFAEVIMIDGQQLAPTEFGEFDSDSPTIWKPKDVSGLTFGTNGFYLDFKDSSALGNDVSGNNHDFTANNLTAVDQSTDTCTNNFATYNSLANKIAASTFTEGNLNVAHSSNKGGNLSTIGFSTGKWYAEMKILSIPTDERWHWGIMPHDCHVADDPINTGNDGIMLSAFNAVIYANNGSGHAIINNFFGNSTTAFDSFSGIMGLAVDATSSTKTIAMSKDGAWITGSGTTDTDFSNALKVDISTAFARYPFWHIGTGTGTTAGNGVYSLNFGSPSFAISSSNADGEGFGNFEFPVPSGYFALCSKNLAEYG